MKYLERINSLGFEINQKHNKPYLEWIFPTEPLNIKILIFYKALKIYINNYVINILNL